MHVMTKHAIRRAITRAVHGLNAGAMVFACSCAALLAVLSLFGGGWASIAGAVLAMALGCCNGAMARAIKAKALRLDTW